MSAGATVARACCALDALTRGTLQDELCAQTSQAVLMITYGIDEAILLAERIILKTNGPDARICEIVRVYGTTLQTVIEEQFGDGSMSAIDFDMSIARKEDPKGDRVTITMSGKILPYRT